MKKNIFFFGLCSLLGGFVFAKTQPAVVILSLDGVGFNQLREIDPHVIDSWGIARILPPKFSVTFPGHTSLATGVWPDTHGVKSNMGYKSDPDLIQVEPMWTTAFLEGMRARTFLWPLSYGPWHGIHHHSDQTYTAYKKHYGFTDVAKDAIETLQTWDQSVPLLFMGRTPGLDDEGHSFGPTSVEVRKAWKTLKAQIQTFIQDVNNLRKTRQITAFFVSDHGMAPVEKCPLPCRYLRKQQDQGFHGMDPPILNDMYGVVWTFPNDSGKLPQTQVDLKPVVFQLLESRY